MSVDHVPVLKAWAESLGGITYPLLSDFWPHGEAAREWGVFREEEGSSERAIFIVDAAGIVRYADVHDIADQPDNAELFGVLEILEPGRAEALHAEEAAARDGADEHADEAKDSGEPGLLMFCTAWCPDCRAARDWLAAHDIPFREIDVSRDPDARARAAAHNHGHLHTPTFEFGAEVCVDFRPDRLSELLGMDRRHAT